MAGDALARLFGINAQVIEANTEGMTDEESLLQPVPGGNCANWVLGHIVATRNSVMKLIGEDPVWNEEQASVYRRGADPLTDAARATSFKQMLNDMRASQQKLTKRLGEMSGDELAAAAEDDTVAGQLAILHFHEAYHIGQLGLIRRLAGKPGAIK
ncbi:DinB family protein [Candidatus Eisenbacteria bacterium]|uniref:DinB family protein n=1 Tax=Eiseniibacteriota bacterium TaxID=2212470 RepID=A0ABV6YIN8_UNCEI